MQLGAREGCGNDENVAQHLWVVLFEEVEHYEAVRERHPKIEKERRIPACAQSLNRFVAVRRHVYVEITMQQRREKRAGCFVIVRQQDVLFLDFGHGGELCFGLAASYTVGLSEAHLARRRGTYDEDRPDVERRGGKRRKAGLTSEELLESGGWGEGFDVDPHDAAIVISIGSGRCRLFHEDREFDCMVPPELAVRQKSALAVGDRVVSATSDGACRLTAVLPRRTVLSRPDPLNPHLQRLIAANIDVVVHVVSVKAPPLRPRLIDRFLIAIQRGGSQAVICVNKIDLLDADERHRELASLDPYRDLGVPVVACSVRNEEGIAELRALVEGKTCALVGHSGVGKSSILNALDERLEIATGELHKRGTGRHTTTSSTLHDLGGGTFLIDTPGIREFGLWNLTLETLRDYFPEFAEPGEYCRFNDCTHLHEPGCAVKERAEAGELSRARYQAYVRLAEDLSVPSR